MHIDILVLRIIFLKMEQCFTLIILVTKYYLEILFKILLHCVKFQLLTAFSQFSAILYKLNTIAFTDTHSFGVA